MYKDKSKQREANRLRMQRARVTQKVTQTQGSTTKDVLPAYLIAIVDKRAKMEAIVEQLSRHKLLDDVRYGVNGPTFKDIAAILEDTA